MADELFDRALRIATVSSGADLIGFSLDLAYVLEQKAGFSTISVIKTGDQRCMLRATYSAQPSTDVAALLLHIREEDLRYAAFAARRMLAQPRSWSSLRAVGKPRDRCASPA